VKVVIDHVGGSRRGQRQELDPEKRVRFGRHPECEVSFDAHRDIDASTRHAELRRQHDAWVLVDVGSSNGTFVDGKRVTEAPVAAGTPLTVQFGPEGPKLRLFIGDEAQVGQLAAPLVEAPAGPPRTLLLVAAALIIVAAVVVAVLFLI
jgi:pSer/pThr/pTyr-binding forkhead associated (FHA) protein